MFLTTLLLLRSPYTRVFEPPPWRHTRRSRCGPNVSRRCTSRCPRDNCGPLEADSQESASLDEGRDRDLSRVENQRLWKISDGGAQLALNTRPDYKSAPPELRQELRRRLVDLRGVVAAGEAQGEMDRAGVDPALEPLEQTL